MAKNRSSMIARFWNCCILCLMLMCPLLLAQSLNFDISHVFTPADSSVLSLSKSWDFREHKGEWVKTQIPGRLNRTGQFDFRTYFSMDSTVEADLYKLYLHGVDATGLFYLNKKIVGGHAGGQTIPFSLDIRRESLYFQEYNELFIELDTRLNFRNTIPMKTHPFGLPEVTRGIHEPVELVPVHKPYLLQLSMDRATDSGIVRCAVDLQMPSSAPDRDMDTKFKMLVELTSDSSATVLWQGSMALECVDVTKPCSLAFGIPADIVQNWSPDTPNLYRLKMSLRSKTIDYPFPSLTFGLRSIAFANNIFSVNNSPTRLKIVEWVNDQSIAALSGDSLHIRIRHDLLAIKQLGANAVRVFPCSPSPVFFDECNRVGLLVLIDMPLINIPSGLLQNDFAYTASELLGELIRTFRHHPCIIAWGLGSGYNAGSAQARNFLEKLKSDALELDDRPVYAGKRGRNKLKMKLPVDLEIIELEPEELQQIARDSVSVMAADAGIFRLMMPLNRIGRTMQSAERDQAFILSMALKQISLDKNTGVLIAPLRDWRANTPFSMWDPGKDANLFQAGLLDRNGEKRAAYDIVRARLNATDVPTILPTEEINDENYIFQLVGFGLLIVFLIFFRSNRLLRNYLRRIFLFPHGFYIDIVENRHVNFFLTVLIGLSCFTSIAVIGASFFYRVRTNLLFDEILSWLCLSPQLKSQIIWLVWNPVFFMITIILGLLLITILQSFIFRMIIFMQRRYLKLLHCLIFVFWVPANLLFSIPLAVVFHRMLNNPEFISICVIGLLVLFIWLIVRIIRGTIILLQLSNFKSFIIFAFTFIFFAGLLFYYCEQSRSIVDFSCYWWSLFKM